MTARGGKPIAELRKHRIEAPKELEAEALTHWHAIVNSLPAHHFAQSDAAVLAEYCRTLVLAHRAYSMLAGNGAVTRSGNCPSPWNEIRMQQVRAIALLTRSLRLAPMSRFDRLAAATTGRGEAKQKKPWE